VRTIAAWDVEREGRVTTSEKDEALWKELAALGYLD
jgi:hypothetical protein